jgi:CHAT domain-containing protein
MAMQRTRFNEIVKRVSRASIPFIISMLYFSISIIAQTGTTETISPCDLKIDEWACKQKPGESVQVLTPGAQPVVREINGGERHLYNVDLVAGEFAQIIVEQLGVDVTLSLCSGDGHRISEVDRQSGSAGPEKLSIIAPADGTYLLQVKPLPDTTLKGSYRVQVTPLREPVSTDETRIKAEKAVSEGGAYFDRGRPNCLQQSIDKYKEAQKLWQSLDDEYETAITLYGLGWSYSKLGSYGMVKFPSPQHTLRWSYASRTDHEMALKYFEQALRMVEAQNNLHGQAITLAGIAWPQLYLGQSNDALASFSKAAAIFRDLNNKRGEAICEYGRGWAYALLNDNPAALNSFLRALNLRRESGDNKGGPPTLAAISRIYSRLGDYQEAIKYDLRAIEGYDAIKDAQGKSDSRGKASTWADLGWVYLSLDQPSAALDCFQKSLTESPGLDETGRANVTYGQARAQSRLDHLTEAASAMEAVCEEIERFRSKGSASDLRTFYSANVQEYYEFYISILMKLQAAHPSDGFAAKALAISERARARELLSILAQSNSTNEQKYELALGRPLSVSDIQRMLDPETLLLEYALGDEKSFVWLVSSNSIASFELPKRKQIESMASSFYDALVERNNARGVVNEIEWKRRVFQADATAEKAAEELGRILVDVLYPRLGQKRLVVVTEGSLQLVPFSSLLTKRGSEGNASVPLFVDHQIVTLPSFSVLSVLRSYSSRPTTQQTVAIFADPVFAADDPRLPSVSTIDQSVSLERSADGEKVGRVTAYRRLPGTRWEAEQIASLVSKNETLLAVDFNANRDAALDRQLGDYRIIHFATHAFVDDNYPSRSKIVLSQFTAKGDAEDGNLTVPDIYKMHIKADLVVLSACKTALGVNTRGEGIVGLTGAFMQAGAPRVLVSLWAISDTAAADFMARFYRKLLGPDKLPPDVALRRTQIETWKDKRFKSPYYWAPFVLSGDWQWRN